MPLSYKHVWSIRVKILGSLLLICSLSVGIVLFGMWKYQQKKYIEDTHNKALLTGQAVTSTLDFAMLHNDHEAIQGNLEELARFSPLTRVSIINKQGVIAKSSDKTSIGTKLFKSSSTTCQACHKSKNPDRKAIPLILEENAEMHRESPHLVTIIPIANKNPCQKCHEPSDNRCGLGALCLDYSLEGTYEIMRTVTKRMVLSGVGTFMVIILSISWIVSHFITQPIDSFMKGIRQVEEGDPDAWVNAKVSGEFAEMADSFNVMARAVSKYNIEVNAKKHEFILLFNIVKKMSETMEWNKVKNVLLNQLFKIFNLDNVSLLLPVDNNSSQVNIEIKTTGDKRLIRKILDIDQFDNSIDCLRKEDINDWLNNALPQVLYFDNCNKVLIPLRLKGVNLGLICAQKPPGQHFTFREKELLPTITKHITVSFGNARFFHLATTDGLTSLYAKRFFETALNFQVKDHQKTGNKFCLLMIDLDHFKSVNDTYGHPVGDEVLKTVAKLVKEGLRHCDIACRYGGEEFVILLPGASIAEAEIIAERLRQSVEKYQFNFEGFQPFKKTISIGLAHFPQHAANGEDLIRVVDSFLYIAKDNGRNCLYYDKLEKEIGTT